MKVFFQAISLKSAVVEDYERWLDTWADLPSVLANHPKFEVDACPDHHLLVAARPALEAAGVTADDVFDLGFSADGAKFTTYYSALPFVVHPDGSLRWNVALQDDSVTVGNLQRTIEAGFLPPESLNFVLLDATPKGGESGELWWADLLEILHGHLHDLNDIADGIVLYSLAISWLTTHMHDFIKRGASVDSVCRTVLSREHWDADNLARLLALDHVEVVKLLGVLGYRQIETGLFRRVHADDLPDANRRLLSSWSGDVP